jgi:polar amino acid transport system substrate-binding protein
MEETIMKKLLTLILTVALVLSVFAACGTETAQNQEADLAIAAELTSEEYGIGFRKGSDLTAVVNGYIAELKSAGTLDELATKYELVLAESEPAETEEATLKDVDYVKANGKMVIGITDYAPMNYKDEEGNWTGFDTEFALLICEKLGVEAEFVEIDWDGKFLALESKAIDCIWNGMTISDEVLKNTSCSVAYVKNAQVVVMTKANAEKYTDAASMKDLTFAVEAGSAGEEQATANGFKKTPVLDQATALSEVAAGTCDAAIIDSLMAGAMIGEGTGYANLTYTAGLNTEEYGVGFRKGSDIVAEFNTFYAAEVANGNAQKVAETYGVEAALIK